MESLHGLYTISDIIRYIRYYTIQIMLTLDIEGFYEGCWSSQGIRHMNCNEACFTWECKWTCHVCTIRCLDFVENWSNTKILQAVEICSRTDS